MGDITLIAWIIATILLTAVFLFAWRMTGSLWKSWIVMIFFGKMLAVFYWAAGLDRTVLVLEARQKTTGQVVTIEFGASFLVLVSFFTTLLATLYLKSLVGDRSEQAASRA